MSLSDFTPEQLAALTPEQLAALAGPSGAQDQSASTEAKAEGITRNLDPVRVKVDDVLSVEVRPTSRDGKMLRAPRAYAIVADAKGKERAARSFTREQMDSLATADYASAFATVAAQAFPDAE